MKELAFRGVYRPRQNQMFRQGKTDGTFGKQPQSSTEDYLAGYEVGRKFRLEMRKHGANIQVQGGLFTDQFKDKR